jgi:hypothetical protein
MVELLIMVWEWLDTVAGVLGMAIGVLLYWMVMIWPYLFWTTRGAPGSPSVSGRTVAASSAIVVTELSEGLKTIVVAAGDDAGVAWMSPEDWTLTWMLGATDNKSSAAVEAALTAVVFTEGVRGGTREAGDAFSVANGAGSLLAAVAG